MSYAVIEERLQKVMALSLTEGAHSPDSQYCVMEAVAYVAGEDWSDHPQCACPVISRFLRSWNDSLPSDAERDRLLKPLIQKLVNTRRTKKVEEKRAMMCADWLVRVNTPAWLRLAGLTAQAERLESLPRIVKFAQVPSIKATIEAVRDDARNAGAAAGAAAWDAARDAAWDAAGDAARDAARAAAWAAAGAAAWAAARAAARAAAWAAAWDAAWDAARAAAGAAAGVKLKPTVEKLQQSALELVEHMIKVR